jgi:hypothetical protein
MTTSEPTPRLHSGREVVIGACNCAKLLWDVVVDSSSVEMHVAFKNRQNDDRLPTDLIDDAIASGNDLAEVVSPDFWDDSTGTREMREAADGVHDLARPTPRCFRFVASYEVTNIAHISACSV